ncbi:DgyrCDS1892 [Dimorphilus gyrociliatus]|uniref:DgyrCDS1892 n=1 Tax=Dimorphilus gyrociliatus TaxID=2664684 RepID=A0A7I8VAF8_9ANNE|nr:DgyrCDS1892 [Dimorphilus gyrociliatus]
MQTKIKVNDTIDWRDSLIKVSEMDLWDDKRFERQEWKCLLKEAENLLKNSRKKYSPDIVENILSGNLTELIETQLPKSNRRIIVFVSSTFTDTLAERNTLMKDVYPFLRKLCQTLNMDFGTVDMRWGVKEEVSLEHDTVRVCLKEVERCTSESSGPSFLAIVGDKYGYRPIPSEIEKNEFELLLKHVKVNEAVILRKYYCLDLNNIPPIYFLKPITREQKDWWSISSQMSTFLRSAAEIALKNDDKKRRKYFISVTENEIEQGVLKNQRVNDKVVVVLRHLHQIEGDRHIHRHLIDIDSEKSQINKDSQKCLSTLKKTVKASIDDKNKYECTYKTSDVRSCSQDVRKSCDQICTSLSRLILQNYEQYLHVEVDDLIDEILLHRNTIIDKLKVFYGRNEIVNSLKMNIKEKINTETTEMKKLIPISVVISRFLGTTAKSGNVRNLLESVHLQILRAYGIADKPKAESFKDLIILFKEAIKNYPTAERPLIIVLDSLDQLSMENSAHNLQWLPGLKEPLPAFCQVIVSTLPSPFGPLDIIQQILEPSYIFSVRELTVDDGREIMNSILASKHRTLTSNQKEIIINAFTKTPIPLFLKLATDSATKWKSSDVDTSIGSSIPDLINDLFHKIEKRYGLTLVRKAFGYITASKNGLSSIELEDILSLDDDVLDETFSHWIPPFPRIPQLLWLRIRDEVSEYLVEKGVDGVMTYSWYHRQFWKVAQTRYLSQEENWSWQGIVNYFQGVYADGKRYAGKAKVSQEAVVMYDRRIQPQSLILHEGSSTSNKIFNKRKLRELPLALIRLKDWNNFEKWTLNLPFIEARFAAGQGHECLSDLLEASKQSEKLQEYHKFVGANVTHLLRDPECVYQLASQHTSAAIRNLLEQPNLQLSDTRILLKDVNPESIDDPCLLTLQGHEKGIRCCEFSTDGSYIVSVANDGEHGSIKIWDTHSGEETVTITNLSGPPFPGLVDDYHGEQSCTFIQSSSVAVGCDDGHLEVFSINGLKIYSEKVHGNAVSGLDKSRETSLLATCSVDRTAKIFETDGYNIIKEMFEIELPGPASNCAFDPITNQLGVAVFNSQYGLVCIDSATGKIKWSSQAACGKTLCLAWSPSELVVVTGGDDSMITVISSINGDQLEKLHGHKGWLWCLKFTEDGQALLSGSSDRTLKVWNTATSSCVCTLGGHVHRVGWISLYGKSRLATASLDNSIKIWDLRPVVFGNVPTVGGLHYLVLKISPDRKNLLSSQGWMTTCEIKKAHDEKILFYSTSHKGFIWDALFTLDSNYIISVDLGHKGTYNKGAVEKATVHVTDNQNGSHITTLDAFSPCSIALNSTLIAVGTETLEFNIHIYSIELWVETSVIRFWENDDDICREATSVGWLAMNEQFLAATSGKVLKIWSLANDEQIEMIIRISEFHSSLTNISFIPNLSNHLTVCDSSGNICVIEFQKDKKIMKWIKSPQSHSAFNSSIKHATWDNTGSYFAATAVEMCIRIWKRIKDNEMIFHGVFYAPANQLAFIDRNMILVGEATGNKKTIQF